MGLGTAASPYHIRHASDLKCFFEAEDVDLNPVYCGNSSNTGTYYKLENSVDIGTKTDWAFLDFYGHFDGNSQEISGSINIADDDFRCDFGLLGRNYGSISDLEVALALDISVVNSDTYVYAGGICGNNLGTITGCTNNGAVTVNSLAMGVYSYAGGICGRNYGGVAGCTNNGAIAVSVTGLYSQAETGGICGKNGGTGVVYESTNTSAQIMATAPTCYTASIVGYNSGKVYDCCEDTSSGGLSLCGGQAALACPGDDQDHPADIAS